MLIEGGLVAKALGKIVDMFLLNLRLPEAGGAAAGQTLTKAIPVVIAFHRTLPGADQCDDIAVVVAAAGKDVNPVGVQRPGAVKLLAA